MVRIQETTPDITFAAPIIRIEPADIQHLLLREYVDFIIRDLPEGQFRLQYHINYPLDSEDKEMKLMEKIVYFKLK